MASMDRETGKLIEGPDEIEQSINEILGTIPGDRVMRADYGSELFKLTDIGMDASGKARLAQATAQALRTYEPRVRVTRVAHEGAPGEMTTTIHGTVKATNQRIEVQR